GVVKVRTLAPDHEPGRAADLREGPHGRVHATRYHRFGPVEQRLGRRRLARIALGHVSCLPRGNGHSVTALCVADAGLPVALPAQRRVRPHTVCSMTPKPPVAKRVHSERTNHGDTIVDEYAWLAKKDDPETVAYLTAENEYTKARTSDQADL